MSLDNSELGRGYIRIFAWHKSPCSLSGVILGLWDMLKVPCSTLHLVDVCMQESVKAIFRGTGSRFQMIKAFCSINLIYEAKTIA